MLQYVPSCLIDYFFGNKLPIIFGGNVLSPAVVKSQLTENPVGDGTNLYCPWGSFFVVLYVYCIHFGNVFIHRIVLL